MTDYSKLKQLAEAATPGPWTWDARGNLNAPSLDDPSAVIRSEAYEGMWFGVYSSKSQNLANEEWFAASNPAEILALIAENERLSLELKDFQWGASVEAQAGDEARAEANALRKDAERLKKAAAFVQQLCDAAGKQPSVATGYLHDILSVMSKEPKA